MVPGSIGKLFLLVGIAYVGLCAVLFLGQRSLIYFPQPASDVEDAVRESLSVDGVELRITILPRAGAAALMYFGGNAEDVGYSLPTLRRAFPDRALYLMHYRGYGGSGGRPTEAALTSDAQALFDRVRGEHDRVLVVGRSLGSAIAVQLAASREIEALVLVTPFDSLESLARSQFPFLPVRWLLRDRYESTRHAESVQAPTRLIAAESDEIVPRRSTESLLESFPPGIASLRVISGTGHNTIGMSPEYLPALAMEP